ncbi:MAG TPA: non-canonical purine NTP pyrophosphatase [Verrucomicrobiae bacterium]
MKTLVIATRNAHKVGEIRAILGEGFRYLTLTDFPGAPEVIEDAPTFGGNATKKAVALALWLAETQDAECMVQSAECRAHNEERWVLADDSGLEVDALGGAPGVHSARFAALDSGAAGNSSTAENNTKLLRLLREVPAKRRTARFKCVIALVPVSSIQPATASPVCYADEAELQTRLFEGVCEGRIITDPKGRGGFGYDPLFVPEGYDQTFGELSEAIKNRLSHRARALSALKKAMPQ